MCRGSPKGLSHASHSNGINDQYTGPGGQMAQLKAWGGCSGKEYGITVWDYRLPDYRTGPFTDCLGNDTATYRKHAEGRSFLKFKPLKFSLYRLIEFKFKRFF